MRLVIYFAEFCFYQWIGHFLGYSKVLEKEFRPIIHPHKCCACKIHIENLKRNLNWCFYCFLKSFATLFVNSHFIDSTRKCIRRTENEKKYCLEYFVHISDSKCLTSSETDGQHVSMVRFQFCPHIATNETTFLNYRHPKSSSARHTIRFRKSNHDWWRKVHRP